VTEVERVWCYTFTLQVVDSYLECLTITARKRGIRVLALPTQAIHECAKMLDGQDMSDWLCEKVIIIGNVCIIMVHIL
jgi:hypothetical protein